ncbi:zinc finger protein 43-like [Pectinophora gossypiella]|uniref:zinc finger protein 43-like n=1 Tax=Pectinophora gossypiella TaxID=13191 RepID=UPI00214F55DA|nr:zinc finger protein 43-like [Pectinophora gossypiella]
MTDDDGAEIKLTVLKTPICLENLDVEYEVKTKKDIIKRDRKLNQKKVRKEKITRDVYRKKKEVKTLKVKKGKDVDEAKHYRMNISLLKEPISLDDIDWGDETEENALGSEKAVTFNVKTIQGTFTRTQKKKKENSAEFETWKQNALTIFENSYVYPFVYANNKYKCFACSNPFLNANVLKDHTLSEHSIEDIKHELTNRVRDKNLKVDVTYLQCKSCLQTLPNLQSMKLHLKDHGKEIDPYFQDNIIPFKLAGDTFDCQICGEAFLKLRLLVIHMSRHFNNYSCEICGSVFISLKHLKRHHQTHESGSFPCDKCDKVFSSTAKRSIHMRGVHLKQFPRRCPICPERFNSNYQRTKHLRIVHNQSTGLYRCETCGREYDLKYHLLVHIRSVHLQERNQECPVCHSRFFSKYCLSRHMVIHTGDKNFKCEVCGKAYARKKNLREHCRMHEVGAVTCGLQSLPNQRPGPRSSIWQMTISERQNAATFFEYTTVKPFFYQQANFKCFYCNEVFPEIHSVLQHTAFHATPDRSALLKQHLRKGKRVIKVDISGLKCKICEQKYSDLDDIRKHLAAAHKKDFNSAGNGLMAYNLSVNNGLLSCHKCEKTFNSFFLLNRHMNVHFSVVCETCGLGFMSHQRLINHRIVHQNGIHRCEKCQEIFQTKLKLRYHIFKKHEVTNAKKIKPLKCPHCLERFAEHYRKMTHLKEAHGITFTFECQISDSPNCLECDRIEDVTIL